MERKMHTMEDRNNRLVKVNLKLDEYEAKREYAIENLFNSNWLMKLLMVGTLF